MKSEERARARARVARGRPIILFIRAYVRLCDTKDCAVFVLCMYIYLSLDENNVLPDENKRLLNSNGDN